MKKHTLRILAVSLLATLVMASCSLVNQMASVANLVNCKYALNNVSDLYVAGVSVKNVTNGNITASDVLKLTAALASKKVPLTMSVNVDVSNPTETAASLTAMDWVCEIDGMQLATGTSNKAFNIAPNKTTTVALPVTADVYSVFSSKGIESLKNFVTGFKSDGTNDKIAIGIRPMLKMGEMNIPTPGYINVVGKCTTVSATNASNGGSSKKN